VLGWESIFFPGRKQWKNYSKGLGISISYDSPIGPIEFSISSDLKHKRPIGSISIGYKLD